jgi:hypothetical protein
MSYDDFVYNIIHLNTAYMQAIGEINNDYVRAYRKLFNC